MWTPSSRLAERGVGYSNTHEQAFAFALVSAHCIMAHGNDGDRRYDCERRERANDGRDINRMSCPRRLANRPELGHLKIRIVSRGSSRPLDVFKLFSSSDVAARRTVCADAWIV